jgi:predicted esterase
MNSMLHAPSSRIIYSLLFLLLGVVVYQEKKLHQINAWIQKQQKNFYVDSIRTTQIDLVSPQGQTRIKLGVNSDNSGTLRIYSQNNDEIIHLGSTPQKTGVISILNKKKPVSYLSATPDEGGLLGIMNQSRPIALVHEENSKGCIKIFNQDGQTYSDFIPLEIPVYPVGKIIENIPLQDHPDESYCALLPENYTSETPCPVMFMFPTGESIEFLKKYGPSVTRYGWIAVASNNYKGGIEDPFKIVQHIERDVHKRFAVLRGRYYATGFSWGSWLACWMSQQYKDFFSSVIALSPPCMGNTKFRLRTILEIFQETSGKSIYFIVGNKDSFRDEIKFTSLNLQQHYQGYIDYQEFLGGHHLPPVDVFENALKTLECVRLSQKNDISPLEKKFIEHHLQNQYNLLKKLPLNWTKARACSRFFPFKSSIFSLGKNSERIINQVSSEFQTLLNQKSMKNEISAQKLLSKTLVYKIRNIHHLNEAQIICRTLIEKYPNTHAMHDATGFINVLEILKNNIETITREFKELNKKKKTSSF